MPIAFGSLLGGMTTLIGTPPNLIVAGFRQETGSAPFSMFDYTPVGAAVAVAGVLLIVLGGWKLVPARREAAAEGFDPGAYLTELRVPEGARAVGRTVREVEALLDRHDAQVVGMVQGEFRVHAPDPSRVVHAGDILVVEADADVLSDVLAVLGAKLEEDVRASPRDRSAASSVDDAAPAATAPRPAASPGLSAAGDAPDSADPRGDDRQDGTGDGDDRTDPARTPHADILLQEIAVLPGSGLAGRSAIELDLRTRYSINVLAISRAGHRSRRRLRSQHFQDGDLLLVQGTQAAISAFASAFGGVPLAERALRIPDRRKAITASLIMLGAIAVTALGLMPVAVAFALGVIASMALRTVPPRDVYTAIDWPVVVLLAALIPVAGAMESTGTAALIARVLFDTVAQGHPVIALALILVITMTLSDLMNNAATATVMCPIAISAAAALGVNADAFLMAVAVGASCAFLTPIGHQNNTLILGPGGFRFGDYWRLGLPVQLVVGAVSIPMLLLVWPL